MKVLICLSFKILPSNNEYEIDVKVKWICRIQLIYINNWDVQNESYLTQNQVLDIFECRIFESEPLQTQIRIKLSLTRIELPSDQIWLGLVQLNHARKPKR